jgi:hypothetical protein
MKLTELNYSSINIAKKALNEHYKMPFNLDRMSLPETKVMLNKVRGLISETKQSPTFYRSQNDASYLKLVFMEQALAKYFSQLRSQPKARIVTENEEVEKSQVVLAAQDMVDSVQKMLEQVSDMLVKEMPALVDSVQSEIGANEAEQFSSQTSEALTTLTAALTSAKTSLQNSVNVVTGQGDTGAFDSESMGGEEDMDMGDVGDEGDFGSDTDFPEAEPEEEPPEPTGRVGRPLR